MSESGSVHEGEGRPEATPSCALVYVVSNATGGLLGGVYADRGDAEARASALNADAQFQLAWQVTSVPAFGLVPAP